MRTTTRTRCLAALITTTSLLGVSACGSKASTAQPITVPSTVSASPTGGTPSIAPSPSVSASSSVNGAEDVATRYVEEQQLIMENPTEPISNLTHYGRDQAYTGWISYFMNMRAQKLKVAGDIRKVSMTSTATKYQQYPAFLVKGCYDVSNVSVVNPSGKSMVSPKRLSRSIALYTVAHEKDGWFVVNYEGTNTSC